MVKIRVSYQTTQELQEVLKLLHPAIKSYKISGNKAGSYHKAYVWVKETEAVGKQ